MAGTFGSGIKRIQYGTVTLTDGSGTATITAVDTAKTFLIYLGAVYAYQYPPRITLTDATTITGTSAEPSGTTTVAFCAVEVY